MHLVVTLDHEALEQAGAGGMFQINSVSDGENGDDLSHFVDVGLQFSDEEGLAKYLRKEFGQHSSFQVVN